MILAPEPQRTGMVREVDAARQVLRVKIVRSADVVEVPFQNARLIYRRQRGPRRKILFEVGEVVRIVDGPFANFQGTVEAVDREKGRLRVSVLIFGRATPADLDLSQVQKA
jgi:transcription antitermination factor NusG